MSGSGGFIPPVTRLKLAAIIGSDFGDAISGWYLLWVVVEAYFFISSHLVSCQFKEGKKGKLISRLTECS